MGTLAYRSLRQPKLYQAIVQVIEQRIVTGELRPGDTLPPERELAHQFDVSRTAVREAVKVLAQKQLVSVIHGKGVVVATPSSSSVAAPLSLLFRLGKATPLELTEVRRFLEPEIAALAATRADAEDLAAMERILLAYPKSLDSPEQSVSLSVELHRALARAAKNEVASAMVDSIQDLLSESMLNNFHVQGAVEKAIDYQSRICNAVRRRDADAARRETREHLDDVMKDHERLDLQKQQARMTSQPAANAWTEEGRA